MLLSVFIIGKMKMLIEFLQSYIEFIKNQPFVSVCSQKKNVSLINLGTLSITATVSEERQLFYINFSFFFQVIISLY